MKKSNNQEAILSFIAKNEKCSNSQIVAGTKINRETVRVTVNKMVAAGTLTCEKVNGKGLFSVANAVKATKAEKPKKVKPRKITAASTTTVVPDKKIKSVTPAVVRTANGKLGIVNPTEPKVVVKQGLVTVEKTIVHLVKEDLSPVIKNGNPLKMLVIASTLTEIKPARVERGRATKVKVKRQPKTKTGEQQIAKDMTKYVLDGNVLGKGRLVQAIIAKYVRENSPTFAQLAEAFPANKIHPKLFVHFDEALRVNTETKHTRFFAKADDAIKLSGNITIAVTNQVSADVLNKMLAVTPKHNIVVEAAN